MSGAYLNLVKVEVRQSARSLFEAAIAMVKDEEVTTLVDNWRHQRAYLVIRLRGQIVHSTSSQSPVFSQMSIKLRPRLLAHYWLLAI